MLAANTIHHFIPHILHLCRLFVIFDVHKVLHNVSNKHFWYNKLDFIVLEGPTNSCTDNKPEIITKVFKQTFIAFFSHKTFLPDLLSQLIKYFKS